MYQIVKKGDGSIQILKNNKELFSRILNEDNVSIHFIPDQNNPSLIMITEEFEKMQSATFYDANGSYITGIGFDNAAYLRSLQGKPIHIIEQDSDEYNALLEALEQDDRVQFFDIIFEQEAFSIYLKNNCSFLIEKEDQIYETQNLKNQANNFYAYSYFGDLLAKAKVKNEVEAENYLYDILETDSSLVS